MRKFKFRFWDKKKKEFCYDLYLSNEGVFHIYNDYGGIFSSGLEIDDIESEIIIQQFTGIKDIDGKEIYEGDFVELWTVVNQKTPNMRGFYEVIWGCTGFDLKCHKKAAGDVWFQLHKDKKDDSYFVSSKIVIDKMPLKGFNICKIIGNICENKNEKD